MITLRPPQESDVDALYPLLAGTSVTNTLLWDGPDSLEGYRTTWRSTIERVARGEAHTRVVVEESTGAPIGTAGVRPMDSAQGPAFRADLGLWIGEPYQGRGYGTLVVRKLLEYGFATLSLHKIEATVFVGNEASRRVFLKNGFSLEGTIRRAVRKRGTLVDEWLFGLLKEEFRIV